MADNYPGLQSLGNDIYSHEPMLSASSFKYDPASPSIVVLCTWMGGATPTRITRYVNKYRQLFPSSAVVVVRTTIPDMSTRSIATIHARLQPARDAISSAIAKRKHLIPAPRAQHDDNDVAGSVLLHLLSTGGANMGIHLVQSIHAANQPLRLKGLILDCSPGDSQFSRIYRAATLTLPRNPVVQFLGGAALYPYVGLTLTLMKVGVLTSVQDVRRQLNDPEIFPHNVNRLYMYTRVDVAVLPEDVESHLEEAKTKGYQSVDAVPFEAARHCALLVDDEERWSAAILRLWNSCVATNSRERAEPAVEVVQLQPQLQPRPQPHLQPQPQSQSQLRPQLPNPQVPEHEEDPDRRLKLSAKL